MTGPASIFLGSPRAQMGILISILLGPPPIRSRRSEEHLPSDSDRGSTSAPDSLEIDYEARILEGIRVSQASWELDIEENIIDEIRREIESLQESEIEELLLFTDELRDSDTEIES